MEEMNEYEIKHINILDEYLSECMVLLRKNGDFPIVDEKKIYLCGNGVRKTIKGGTGSGEVNSRSFDNIEEAFEKEGFEILSKDFLDAYDAVYKNAQKSFKRGLMFETIKSPISGILKIMGAIMNEPEYDIPLVNEGDVAIYILSRISGEGSDRKFEKGDFLLTDTERKNILTLAKGYKKFMLVLNTGGPVDLSGLDEVKNILVLSQLGVNTSKALAEVISGKKYPSGKLATTWTKQEDYPGIEDFGNPDDTDYKEGIYVGYRYFDSADVDVLFPFGFGLGYTDFSYEVKSINLIGDEVIVEAAVKNIGNAKGKEVLELYMSKPNTSLDEPYQILVSFEKSKELNSNEEDLLKLKFNLSDFASYETVSATYILDVGDYIIRLGNSSRNTVPCAVVHVDSKITVKKVQNKLGKPDFEDKSFTSKKTDDLSSTPKFTLDASSIKEIIVNYDKKFEISDEVKNLSKEDKAKLVIGAFNPKAGITSVIGTSSMSIAGAAGETAKVSNLKPVSMADGPAGLRLATDYYEDENGVHSTQGSVPLSMLEVFPGIVKYAFKFLSPKPPKNAEIKHQFTTAIPIGTAIAQSWNKNLAEVCGDIVGNEMEIFHVNLWLAPALNIHRSVLCGRNFEYFSEDPLISGAMTSSITKGVQKHKNAFVTLKHFAANNQECNRYANSSNVSERALREIYLKGFEICIKESQPKAVMTSYNLINGVHTNESKELTFDILRNEFDFNGIVMTDWIVNAIPNKGNKYASPSSHRVIKATGDIYMPGCKEDYEQILKALENNELTMEELETSATRIYNLAKEIEN